VSALRPALKNPATYLVALGVFALLVGFDASREPSRQLTASAYVSAVHAYQRVGRPLLEGRVRCRYVPTCSEYSIEAVERHGIGAGVVMSVKRLARCQRAVPLGTSDPVV
jgi:putative membrane protein insertion efficiency factor